MQISAIVPFAAAVIIILLATCAALTEGGNFCLRSPKFCQSLCATNPTLKLCPAVMAAAKANTPT